MPRKDKEETRKYQAEYYQKHKEEIATQRKEHYQENIEELRAAKNSRQQQYAKRTNYAANNKYNKTSTKVYTFRCMNTTDVDIIAYLDSLENKAGYIKELIRADILKHKEEEQTT